MRYPNAFRRPFVIALFVVVPCLARGAGWRPLGPDGADIGGLAIDSGGVAVDYPVLVYALRGGSGAGIFRSFNAGVTWVTRETGLRFASSALAVTGTGTLEVGSAGSGIARSIDRGETWTTHNEGLTSLDIRSLAASALTGVIYASTPNGIFRASSAGGAWTSIGPAGAPAGSIYALAVDRNGMTVYASGGTVYKSTDGGATWTSVPVPPFSSLVFDPTTAGVLYSASGDSLYKSVNSGGTWSRIFQVPGIGFESLAVDPLHPQIVFAGAGGFGEGSNDFQSVFRSTDGGITWTLIDAGLPNVYVTSLAFFDGTRLFAGTSNHRINGAGVYLYDTAGPAGPCLASPTQLCLLGGRFRATVTATDPRTGTGATGQALPQTDRYGMFSLPSFTGDPSFPEVILKMADATSVPKPLGGYFWVFHTGLTDLQYTLTVDDLITGAKRTYRNDRSDPTRLCGGADTAAFTN